MGRFRCAVIALHVSHVSVTMTHPRHATRPAASPRSTITSSVAPLTSEQRAHVHRRLLEERATITRRLARYGPDAAGESGATNRVPFHMADLGSDTMQETLEAAFASRDSRTLAEIDAALRRFYSNPTAFGLDEQTGACISFERLDIIPWARRAS